MFVVSFWCVVSLVWVNGVGRWMVDVVEEFDFIVVGSGGGLMVVVLVLCVVGKFVLIFEKIDFVGGIIVCLGGVMWIFCNFFMVCDGVFDSFVEVVFYFDSLVGD